MGIYINDENLGARRVDGAPSAKGVSFNNTGTDLQSTNAEDAIKEIVSILSGCVKFIDKSFTNITTNANKEANLGSNTVMYPESGQLLFITLLSASTGSGTLRLEPGVDKGGNMWVISQNANQTIASISIRSIYLDI